MLKQHALVPSLATYAWAPDDAVVICFTSGTTCLFLLLVFSIITVSLLDLFLFLIGNRYNRKTQGCDDKPLGFHHTVSS